LKDAIAALVVIRLILQFLVQAVGVIVLRITRPEMPRPFRIPWGNAGLAYVVIAPILMTIVALVFSDRFALKWGPVPVALGVVAYFVFPQIKKLIAG